ncbi:hypothetical protein BV898_01420 [Hypsibius exemplaris]|uniref:NodB homology domain-containing protein n=1 Tax=Hypsibius exemplaris TaxID=2072580 RepID=A0A1W0XBX6_HYPEX|nr:hypothetical protein BV898_01420 [Hypsibius exemplaris]
MALQIRLILLCGLSITGMSLYAEAAAGSLVGGAIRGKPGSNSVIKSSAEWVKEFLLQHKVAKDKTFVPVKTGAIIVGGANVSTLAEDRIDIRLKVPIIQPVIVTPSSFAPHQEDDSLERQLKALERNPLDYRSFGKVAQKCVETACKLPNCLCGSDAIPGSIPLEETPQIVMITFDDSVNGMNYQLYQSLFNNDRRNPNGCPIRGTFYVSHEWTDYNLVQNLYSAGHEIASHSISHPFPGKNFTQQDWTDEIAGQRELLARYAAVRPEDVRGMRAPFLQTGGSNQFEMLWRKGFTYDSSMIVSSNNPPMWPYTLDYALPHTCNLGACPTKSYPGLWEMPLVPWSDLVGQRCSMADACHKQANANEVYRLLMSNFKRHYQSNKAPFGIYYHAAWFPANGFSKFLDAILDMPDVWVLTTSQALQWIQKPTPLAKLNKFQPWSCTNMKRPSPCVAPKLCTTCYCGGLRGITTCAASCPDSYPWMKNTTLIAPAAANAKSCKKT